MLFSNWSINWSVKMNKVDWTKYYFKKNDYYPKGSSPSDETKEIWKLGSEINLINKQTDYIKKNDITASEFQSMNVKKLNIL
jgi:hypothetical protein